MPVSIFNNRTPEWFLFSLFFIFSGEPQSGLFFLSNVLWVYDLYGCFLADCFHPVLWSLRVCHPQLRVCYFDRFAPAFSLDTETIWSCHSPSRNHLWALCARCFLVLHEGDWAVWRHPFCVGWWVKRRLICHLMSVCVSHPNLLPNDWGRWGSDRLV